MHIELNENLKEVSRQKKQMETILLHMNDGILAFNKEGEIIQKNNAADKLMGLTGQEKNFKEIFDKIDSRKNNIFRRLDVNTRKSNHWRKVFKPIFRSI